MPVRQPTAKLRKNRRKGPIKGPETRVRAIKTESGWENAMKASERRYVIVHVVTGQKTMAAMNFKSQFHRISSMSSNHHMIFAEAAVVNIKALQELSRVHGNGQFPLVLAFYRQKCIKALKPNSSLPQTVMGGGIGEFSHNAKNAVDTLAEEAPKPGPWRSLLLKAALAVSALSAGGFIASSHHKVRSLFGHCNDNGSDSDDSSNLFEDVMEFDIAAGDDFDIDDAEDPLSLP